MYGFSLFTSIFRVFFFDSASVASDVSTWLNVESIKSKTKRTLREDDDNGWKGILSYTMFSFFALVPLSRDPFEASCRSIAIRKID